MQPWLEEIVNTPADHQLRHEVAMQSFEDWVCEEILKNFQAAFLRGVDPATGLYRGED